MLGFFEALIFFSLVSAGRDMEAKWPCQEKAWSWSGQPGQGSLAGLFSEVRGLDGQVRSEYSVKRQAGRTVTSAATPAGEGQVRGQLVAADSL